MKRKVNQYLRHYQFVLAEDVHLNHEEFRAAIENYRSRILRVIHFFFPGVEDCLDELQPDCDVNLLETKILNNLRYFSICLGKYS